MADDLFDDCTTYAPLVLFEYDHSPGDYCLMVSDNHMVALMDVFEAADQYGNGYGWEGVGRQAAAERGVSGRVEFDSEAGTFVAFGEDLEALKAIGEVMAEAFADRGRLAALIEAADDDWFD